MTRELAESISLRRALIVAGPFLILGLLGFVFFLTQGIAMHDGSLIVASGFVLFGVAGLVFNVAMLMKLRRRL